MLINHQLTDSVTESELKRSEFQIRSSDSKQKTDVINKLYRLTK